MIFVSGKEGVIPEVMDVETALKNNETSICRFNKSYFLINFLTILPFSD